MIYLYRGKNINDMSKEELVDAVKCLGKTLNETFDNFKNYSDVMRLRNIKL